MISIYQATFLACTSTAANVALVALRPGLINALIVFSSIVAVPIKARALPLDFKKARSIANLTLISAMPPQKRLH